MEAPQEFDQRISRVRQAMRDKGLQALLVYDSGRHNFLRMNYVAYLTDFISVGPETMLVLPLEDAPVLYLSPVWDIPRAQEESWVSDVRPFKEFLSRLPNLTGQGGLIGREAMHDQDATSRIRMLSSASSPAPLICIPITVWSMHAGTSSMSPARQIRNGRWT